jgi:methyltransferase
VGGAVLFLGFWIVWGALLAQRLVEMWASARTTAALEAAGGRRVADDGYGLLAATHTAFFLASAIEAARAPWPMGVGKWNAAGLLLLLAGEGLRLWAITALGDRWTTRIVVLPGAALVRTGPYRFLRHPIYVGVTLMLVGFPLLFGLWWTLAVVLVLHAVALTRRIRREQAALADVALAGAP